MIASRKRRENVAKAAAKTSRKRREKLFENVAP